MVIVKIKKKLYAIWSGTFMHHWSLFILFWLDAMFETCVLTKNEEKLVLKKTPYAETTPIKIGTYVQVFFPRETIGQRNWFCSVFSAS